MTTFSPGFGFRGTSAGPHAAFCPGSLDAPALTPRDEGVFTHQAAPGIAAGKGVPFGSLPQDNPNRSSAGKQADPVSRYVAKAEKMVVT